MITTTITVSGEVHAAAKAKVREARRAGRRGFSVSAYIEELLRQDLDGAVAAVADEDAEGRS